MEKLISIVVPVYKIKDYLEKCVYSIFSQSYKNLEIILVDDGSPDECGEICDRLAREDLRVKVLHKINGGLSDARNAGVKIATGEYVAFIDGDDYIHEDYISKLYNAIIQENSEVAVCSFSLVKEDQVIGKELVSESTCVISGKNLLERVLTDDGYKYVVAWNKLYKRNIFNTHHFAMGKLYEDEYINFELFWDVEKVVLVPDSLYFYIQRSGSIQGSNMTLEKIWMKQEMHRKRIEFYEMHCAGNLLMRSRQMYCNWLVSTVQNYREMLNNNEMKILQNELRIFSKEVEASKGEIIQNFIARINLSFAGRIKAMYKR